jgi:hypothetical protein
VKEQLCRAFCDQLRVEDLPSGWAVTTPYRQPDGDPIMFFVMKAGRASVRIEDDGAQISLLEASGINLDPTKMRGKAFEELLGQYGATFTADDGLIHTADLPTESAASAALQFMALMLRIHDLALLSTERVKKTWQEDAMKDIHAAFDATALVEDNAAVSPKLSGFPADAVIRTVGAPPLAIFMATNDSKGLQALVLKMELESYQATPCNVVLMVERAKENALRESTYAYAQSRLDGVLTYRGAETDAMARLATWVPSVGAAIQ